MPRGPQGQKRSADVIGAAIMGVRLATHEISEQPKSKFKHAGSGPASARARENLSPQEHRRIAKKTAAVRWR